MKLAVIGSRGIESVELARYIPDSCREVVSGGARGIDRCAEEYARQKGLRLTVFLPDYRRFGRGAPLKRNEQIADYADAALAFWDGRSAGTLYTIRAFLRREKEVTVIRLD